VSLRVAGFPMSSFFFLSRHEPIFSTRGISPCGRVRFPRDRGLCLLWFLPSHLVLVRACLAPDPFTVSGPVSRESLIFCFRSKQGSRQVDSSSLCAFSIFVLLIGFCRFCPRSREVLGSPAGACIVPLEAFSSASGERLLSLPHTA
jgi:hypothetical protein